MKTLKLSTTTTDKYGTWAYRIEVDREEGYCQLEGSTGSLNNSDDIDSIIPDWKDLNDEELIDETEEWLSNINDSVS